MPTEKETRARLRKFLESCVKRELDAEGEHAIDIWEEHMKHCQSEGFYNVYSLTGDDTEQIKSLIAEYRQTREQEDEEREQRRIAEEQADEAMANHYAARIKKIVLSKPNKFLSKPKSKPSLKPRSKSN